MSVARAVRRNPRRSSAARGVTATVSSHRPAANGKRTAESVSMRMMASPPGTQLSAEVRIERARRRGETAMTSAASSMATAEATARRRRRSTSRRRNDAPITRAGRATRPASHSQASLILILASLDRDWPPRRQDGIAQPPIETRQLARESRKGLDDDAVQDAVEESAFERDQKQAAAHAIRCHALRGSRRLETGGRRWRLPSRADRGGRSARSGTAAVESRRVRPDGRTRSCTSRSRSRRR